MRGHGWARANSTTYTKYIMYIMRDSARGILRKHNICAMSIVLTVQNSVETHGIIIVPVFNYVSWSVA